MAVPRTDIAFIFAVHVPIAGISMLPVFFSDWPLLLVPVHIVFLELIIDPPGSLIFEAEDAEANVMDRPPRRTVITASRQWRHFERRAERWRNCRAMQPRRRKPECFDLLIDVRISSLRRKLGDDARAPRFVGTVAQRNIVKALWGR
jgi:hypothetical protein